MSLDFLSVCVCTHMMNIHGCVCKRDTEGERLCVWRRGTGSQMEPLLFNSTLLDIQYTQQREHTHIQVTHSTADERKGLFLDPCIVSEIAREPSEQSRFHLA